MEKILFTSESVSEGHPDKVCDQISDAILDGNLSPDDAFKLQSKIDEKMINSCIDSYDKILKQLNKLEL